jgi:hypothetical protein
LLRVCHSRAPGMVVNLLRGACEAGDWGDEENLVGQRRFGCGLGD